jgi:hypothetical protein
VLRAREGDRRRSYIRKEKVLKEFDRRGEKRDGTIRSTKIGGLPGLRTGMMWAFFQIEGRLALEMERLKSLVK